MGFRSPILTATCIWDLAQPKKHCGGGVGAGMGRLAPPGVSTRGVSCSLKFVEIGNKDYSTTFHAKYVVRSARSASGYILESFEIGVNTPPPVHEGNVKPQKKPLQKDFEMGSKHQWLSFGV